MTQYKEIYKAVIMGDSFTGKSSIANRFINGKYYEKYSQTIGLDFFSKIMRLNNSENIKLQFWDTGGNKNYLPIITSYIKDVAGVIFVVDFTNISSLNNVDFWIQKLNSLNNNNIPKILVATKSDSENKLFSSEDAKKVADEFECHYIETSAKKNENIYEIFDILVHKIDENVKEGVNCGIERGITFIFEEQFDKQPEDECLYCSIC